MDPKHFDLNLLRALDTLLEEQNVTRAAERLFVSQQAASGALQRLRHHFDDELLTRVGRKLEHTPLAKSLVKPVREALLAAQVALVTTPIFNAESADTTCRIAVSDYATIVLLPRFLQRLTFRAPHMRCVVEQLTQGSIERLAMGDLDFCLTAHDPKLYGHHLRRDYIHSMPLFKDDFVCVADPAQIDVSNGVSLEVYKKSRHNSVTFGNNIMTIVQQAWLTSGHDYEIAAEAPNFAALIFMLPGTPLIATTQRRLAYALAPLLGLAITESPLSIPALEEHLLWHERSELDPAHLYLREVFKVAAEDL